jgi:hypothetical protein
VAGPGKETVDTPQIERLFLQAAEARRVARELRGQMEHRRARTREEEAVLVEERVIREHADAAAAREPSL